MKEKSDITKIQEKSIAYKVLSGTGWSYLEKFLVRIITLLVAIVLTRMLLPEHYGVMTVVTIMIAIFDTLVEGGFSNALVQKNNTTDIDYNSVCWLSIGLAVLLYAVLFFLAPVMARFYDNEILTSVTRIVGIKLIFSAFNSVQLAYVQKNMLFHKSFLATLGSKIFSGALGIGLALGGHGVWALVCQYLANTIIDTVIFSYILDWKPRFIIAGESIRSLWRYGSKILLSSLITTLKENVVILLIGRQFSSERLAYYNQGQIYPVLILSDIMESFAKVIFPVFSIKRDNMTVMMKKAFSVSSYFMMPMIIGLFAIADNFISLVLTEKWLPCVPYMRIFCLVCIGRSISNVFQKALLAIGRSNLILGHGIITAVINIIMVLTAIFYFENTVLIAWSYAFVSMVGTIYYIITAHHYFDYTLKDFAEDYVGNLCVSAFMGIGVYCINMLLLPQLVTLIIQVLVGGLFYFGVSAITGNKNYQYIKKLLKNFGNA